MVPLLEGKLAGQPEEGKPHSVLLSRIEAMMWPIMWDTREYWDIRRHFVFAPLLIMEAKEFKARNGLDSRKYMAIHLRWVDIVYN